MTKNFTDTKILPVPIILPIPNFLQIISFHGEFHSLTYKIQGFCVEFHIVQSIYFIHFGSEQNSSNKSVIFNE